jgi:hypothetical protein
MNEDEVIRLLRIMYATQYETDAAGEREVAAWYVLDELEAATGARLF